MNRLISKSLSSTDISKFLNGKANIIAYDTLHKYNHIDQLLGKYGSCVILFLTKPNYGHWTCVFNNINGAIEFFDSYGFKPDSELKYIDKNFRNISYQNYPYLDALLYDSGRNIEYNDHQFQSKKPNHNTCGRWVCLRLLFKDLTLEEFSNLFNIRNADMIITKLTSFI